MRRAVPLRHAGYRGTRWRGLLDVRPGWLATGDAMLATDRRVLDLTRHYGVHLRQVGTMTLPHHGADGNLGDRLLEEVAPSLCVASADRFSTWRHPGSHVPRIVASRGMSMAVVTSSGPSEVLEEVRC